MQYLYEYSDSMKRPYEAFVFDASKAVFPVRSHWHYYTEILYIQEGSVLIESDGVTYILEKGDLVLLYPEAVHAIYAVKGFPIIFFGLKFDVNKLHAPNSYTPRLGRILLRARKDKKIPIVFREEKIRDWHAKRYFEFCMEELTSHSYGYDLLVHNSISELLIKMIRVWYENGFDTELSALEPESSAVESIRSITAYIDEHSGDNLKVEDLAEKCGMSYSFFAKSFHDLYGRSCKEYIELMRVIKAEDMLLFTSQSLSWIAQETGFSDSSHLIKTFSRYKGITPKQFRMKHLSESE